MDIWTVSIQYIFFHICVLYVIFPAFCLIQHAFCRPALSCAAGSGQTGPNYIFSHKKGQDNHMAALSACNFLMRIILPPCRG